METIKISGMSCQHCVNAVKKAVENVDGVSGVKVSLEKGEASYEGTADVEEVKEAVRKAGYQAE
jgi:copper ion binding protein